MTITEPMEVIMQATDVKRLVEQKELLVIALPKLQKLLKRERGAMQTDKQHRDFDHLLGAFSDPGTKEDLSTVFMMFALDMSYDRQAILHAKRVVEFARGWR